MGRVKSEWAYLSRYSLALTPAIAVLIGNYLGDFWTLLNLIYTLVFLGLLELIVPDNQEAPIPMKRESGDWLLLLAWIGHFVAWGSLVFGMWDSSIKGEWVFAAALSTGLCSGSLGIVLSHELIHRSSGKWRILGHAVLWSVGNPYFYIDHLKVHHKYVGTNQDSATARKGESIYKFLYRSVKGQIVASYHLEAQRLAQQGHSVWHFSNYFLWMSWAWIVFLIVMGLWSISIAVALLIQGLFACLLLEYTNYIEHYGLIREKGEKVTEAHSWQSDKVISRFFLFDLSRHADHHHRASKPFHQLKTYSGGPRQPLGYASAFFPALIPPLWFKIMDKALKRWSMGLG